MKKRLFSSHFISIWKKNVFWWWVHTSLEQKIEI